MRGSAPSRGSGFTGMCRHRTIRGVVSFNLEGWDSGETADELARRFSIACRPGAHCAPLMHEALGTREQGAVRFSFSWFNTEEEIEEGIRAVACLAEE